MKISIDFEQDTLTRLGKLAIKQQRKRAQMIRVCVLKGLEFFEHAKEKPRYIEPQEPMEKGDWNG